MTISLKSVKSKDQDNLTLSYEEERELVRAVQHGSLKYLAGDRLWYALLALQRGDAERARRIIVLGPDRTDTDRVHVGKGGAS